MDWNKLLSRKRLGKENEQKEEEGRNQFQKDNDRIIYSGAFRQLGKKTQVHPMPNNDHVHNRLNHSLEVSCVGRSLGTKIGEQLEEDLPEDLNPHDLGTIVQSACLAHDIGNPPFGHVGEEAIRSWFQENENKCFLKDLNAIECRVKMVYKLLLILLTSVTFSVSLPVGAVEDDGTQITATSNAVCGNSLEEVTTDEDVTTNEQNFPHFAELRALGLKWDSERKSYVCKNTSDEGIVSSWWHDFEVMFVNNYLLVTATFRDTENLEQRLASLMSHVLSFEFEWDENQRLLEEAQVLGVIQSRTPERVAEYISDRPSFNRLVQMRFQPLTVRNVDTNDTSELPGVVLIIKK